MNRGQITLKDAEDRLNSVVKELYPGSGLEFRYDRTLLGTITGHIVLEDSIAFGVGEVNRLEYEGLDTLYAVSTETVDKALDNISEKALSMKAVQADKSTELPTYEECEEADVAGEVNALQKFILHNTPVDTVSEGKFRRYLKDAINEVIGKK